MKLKVGATIRRHRKNSGLSQERLATLIDSHQVYISEIEKDKKTPSLKILERMAEVFGISIHRFIEDMEEQFKIESYLDDSDEVASNIEAAINENSFKEERLKILKTRIAREADSQEIFLMGQRYGQESVLNDLAKYFSSKNVDESIMEIFNNYKSLV